MKTIRKVGQTIFAIIVCSLMAACSSDDDEESGNGVSVGKRLAQVEMRSGWSSTITSFTYGEDGELSDIHVAQDDAGHSYTEDVIFTIGTTNMSWLYKDGYYGDNYRFNATLENGRVRKGRIKHDGTSYFTYDGSNRLTEVDMEYRYDDYIDTSTYLLTWDGSNIKKIEYYSDGRLKERIEYTYSKHKAGMLAYEMGFNPFSEFDFLDCVYERAVFYTGYCGALSEKLPSAAIFYDQNGTKIGERSYKYTTSGSTVTSATIDGYYNGDLSYGYPWKMTVTWK